LGKCKHFVFVGGPEVTLETFNQIQISGVLPLYLKICQSKIREKVN